MAISITVYEPTELNMCEVLGTVVVICGLPSPKFHSQLTAFLIVSLKSTVKGTQPEESRGTPLMVDNTAAFTPARLKAIFTMARLHPAPLAGVDVGQASRGTGKT